MCLFMQIPFGFYYYTSVVQLEIRNGDISSSSFIVRDCFEAILFLLLLFCFLFCLFVFSYEAEICTFKICKELHWKLDKDCIESVDCF